MDVVWMVLVDEDECPAQPKDATAARHERHRKRCGTPFTGFFLIRDSFDPNVA
jgi:hypothetical protein